ncbi:BnaC03g44240D [Brassica napus]|uniref:BnaC03g44240D protein n=1 Tax=Brassica napus TaxID=3708 RepID=A0A078FS18_BRANA|nr:BnaC03g44240D [Brassica napus]
MTEFQKQERGVKKMKIVAKIIALASIFSLVLSYSSLVSSLQQSLHLLSMYINLVDKKYMFLLCNGIVGFIMGNFKTLLHGTAMNIVEETEELRINHTRKSEMKNVVALLGEQRVSKKEEGEVVALLGVQRVSKGEGVVALNGELCKDLTVITIDEHDDDDEINDNLLSSEDLNKKCEEFIRKMKAGIRSESRKLLTS